jgi:hypothetical protein
MPDYVKDLEKARAEMVKARRGLAEALAKPFDRGTTPGFRSQFIEIQTAIEQIDKAIIEEQRAAPAARLKGFTEGGGYA